MRCLRSPPPAVSRLFSHGFLVKHGTALERIAEVDYILFDKTGTLTTGKRSILAVKLAQRSEIASPDDLLALAAAVETKSEHVLGEAIVREASLRALRLPAISDFRAQSGFGVSAKWDSSEVLIGGPQMLTANKIELAVQDLVSVAEANDKGNTVVYVVIDQKAAGFIEFGDQIRESAAEAVYQLQRMRVRVAMVTGDATGVANAVAKEVGIDDADSDLENDLLDQK
mgnify:CR=1 FL=1